MIDTIWNWNGEIDGSNDQMFAVECDWFSWLRSVVLRATELNTEYCQFALSVRIEPYSQYGSLKIITREHNSSGQNIYIQIVLSLFFLLLACLSSWSNDTFSRGRIVVSFFFFFNFSSSSFECVWLVRVKRKGDFIYFISRYRVDFCVDLVLQTYRWIWIYIYMIHDTSVTDQRFRVNQNFESVKI